MAWHSGVGTYIRNLVPRVAERLPGWRWTLLVPQGSAHLLGQAERVACTSDIYTVAEQLELRRRLPADASLFWSPHYNVPALTRVPLVTTVHDVAHLSRPEHSGVKGLLRTTYARTMLQHVRRRARAVIFVSQFSRDEFGRLVGAPRRAQVIYNGVDDDWRSPVVGARPHARPYLLFVGSVKPHKNIGALLAAMRLLRDSIPHDLLIVGAFTGMRTIDTGVLADAEAMSDRVRLMGKLDDEALRACMQHAEALVFPSLYEGFGLPPLEAMAAGCPAIVSRIPALVEVCGDAAQYCDPADPADIAARIRAVVSDDALRGRLVATGRERASRFTWERAADETARVLSDSVRVGVGAG